MTKDQWINEVLDSATGIKRVSINPYLHTRIKAKLETPPAKIPLRWALVALAPVMVLMALNVFLWGRPIQQKTNDGMEQVIRAYGLDDSYIYSAVEKTERNEQD